MATHLRTIAQKILDKALKTYQAYPANQFDRAAGCPFHAINDDKGGKIPTEPGERAYTHILSQDFQAARITKAEATEMATINRTSIMGGLKALFPEEHVKEALQGALENFTFTPTEEEETRDYEDTAVMPAIVPSSHGNKSHESSPMHIDREFHSAEFGEDHSRNNTNLTNNELIGGYEFMKEHPEYGLAIRWITGTITDLGKAIDHEIKVNPTYKHLEDAGLRETLNLVIQDGAKALMDGRLPVAVAAELKQRTVEGGAEPTPGEIEPAIQALAVKNILKRPRTNPSGENFTGVCPATRFNMMCLKTTVNGAPALAQFVHKIKAVAEGLDPNASEQNTMDVLTQKHEFSNMMSRMLSTPEAIEAQAEVQLKKAALCPQLSATQSPHT